jgi:hypothetical protein
MAPSPKVPISWGELLDKITILEIKSERIKSERALASVRQELAALSTVAGSIEGNHPALTQLRTELKRVNERLWDVENALREKEAFKIFDHEFVQLARSVYQQNDQRGRIKREINELLGSEFVEEKLYTAYEA